MRGKKVTFLTFQFAEVRILFGGGEVEFVFPLLALLQGQRNQIGSLSVSVSLPQFCPKNRDEKLHGIASEKSSLEEKARKQTLMDFMCLEEVA